MCSLITLLLLATSVLADIREVINIDKSIQMSIKNGFVQVNIIDRIMILNLTKNGEYHSNTIFIYLDKLTFSLLFLQVEMLSLKITFQT